MEIEYTLSSEARRKKKIPDKYIQIQKGKEYAYLPVYCETCQQLYNYAYYHSHHWKSQKHILNLNKTAKDDQRSISNIQLKSEISTS